MKTVNVKIRGLSPYSVSRFHNTPKLPKESYQDHETRTWRERLHKDDNGGVFIPAMAFKNCLAEAAKYLSIQIPGKGKSTYTKHFEAGVMVTDNVDLGVKFNDVPGEWLHVPSDGRRGSNKRVLKCFPVIKNWSATITFYVVDETVTESVFYQHLEQAGLFIGVGRFRPRNNGVYGRFKIENVEWDNVV